MNKFRLLKADEIECRIAQVKSNGIALLLYKTARTDANLLDETVEEFNWQNDFKLIDGVLYGGIGIRQGEYDGYWVWKWDAGTESNTEAEKGRASDAFKRAGFKWGIGRELYSAPFIWIGSDKCSIKDGKCFDKFEVTSIGYDNNSDISELVIVNSKSRVEVFRWTSNDKPKESFNGEDKISAVKVKSLTKTCKDDGIPIGFILQKCKIEKLADMREEQFTNVVSNWENVKKQYREEIDNDRKDS